MAATVLLADTGFLVALLDERDDHHRWAAAQTARTAPPWLTCDAVLSESFFLLGREGSPALIELLRRRALRLSFDLGRQQDSVLALIAKYADVPMSLADACLVRMSELVADPLLLTTDSDFRVYRRHSRQVIPCRMPG